MLFRAHLYIAVRRDRRQRVYYSRRDDLEKLTADEFTEKVRLPPHVYRSLYHSIEHTITPKSNANHAISANTRLQATLRFLAQGSMYSTNCDAYGISKASMSRHITSTVEAICGEVR